MAELDFSDLVPKQSSPQSGQGDLSFDDLLPKQDKSIVPAAIADVPAEVKTAAAQGLQHLTGNSIEGSPGYDPRTRGQLGPIEGLVRTGKQIIGLPETLMSPVVGAARSLIGHPMADVEHAIGTVIAPEIAAHDDPKRMYEAAKGDVDVALSAAGPRGPKGPVITAPTIAELKTASTAGYGAPEIAGLEVKPSAIRGFSDQAQLALDKDGFNDILAPKTFGILQRLQKAPDGATVTGQNLDTIRKTLGKIAGSNDPTEKAAASIAIDHLDEFVPKIGGQDVVAGDPTAAAAKWAEARGNYAAAKQSEKIDKKVVQAEVRAAAANSGMNVANTVRARMADVVLNPKEARGLTPAEIDQAQAISEGTKTQNAMRFAGNMLGGGGGLGSVAAAAGGALLGGPAGALAPAVGYALKALSNRMTLNQAARLSEAIRMRAPLASSMEKFGDALQKYEAAKTPGAYSGTVIAARNLASNLQGAGLHGPIADLIRSMSVPGQSPAGDKREAPRRE
jgi:hypothetical protein